MVAFSSVAELGVAEAPVAAVEISLACGPASFSAAAQYLRFELDIASVEPTATGAVGEFAVAEFPDPRPGSLLALAASFALAGQSAFAAEARRADTAVFTLAGGAIGQAFASAPGTFQLDLATASGAAHFAAAAAAFGLATGPAGIGWPLSPAAFSLTGFEAISGFGVIAGPAGFVVTGRDVVFDLLWGQPEPTGEGAVAEFAVAEFPYPLRFGTYAETASFVLAPRATAAEVAERVETGAFTLTGAEAQIAWPHPPATFALAGQNVGLHTALSSQPAAFALDLVAAQSRWPHEGAAFAVSGQPLRVTTALAVQPAAFTIALETAFVGIRALPGTFVLTGLDLWLNPAIASEPASFTLTGQAAELLNIFKLYPDPASFALTGQDAGRAYTLGPEPGLFLVQGQAAFRTSVALDAAAFGLTGREIRQAIRQKLGTGQFTLLGWNVVDATGPSGDHIFLIEAQAHDGTQVRTVYLGTSDFTSLPSDNPPNTYYASRIKDPGNFDRSLFSSGETRGRSSVGSGDIVVANGDPGHGETLDTWLNWGWSGRPITIKALPVGARSLAAASVLFNGRLSKLTSTRPLDQLELKIADRLADLDKPLLTELFAGTTTSTAPSAEGNADLKGKIKQRCYGTCREVPLQPANPYDLIYLASLGDDVQSVTVYDGGVPLTYDGINASISDLRAASIAPGHYRRFKGYIRLGGVAQFALSADVIEGANAGARTAAQIAYRMLREFGLAPSEFITGAFTELDAANNAGCGYFVDNDRTALTAAQEVLDSVGAWLVPNRDGSFVVGRYSDPSSAPGLTFDIEEQSLGDSLERVDGAIPVYRIVLQYQRVNQVQAESALAGAVTAERRAYLGNEWRTVVAEDASIKAKHLDARELTITTFLTDEAAAQAEANRLLALYKVERDRYRVTLPLSAGWGADVGLAVTLVHPRLGMALGRPFNVIGRTDNYAAESVQLDLWG